MKLNVINIDCKKVNDIDVSDKIFSLKPDNDIIQLRSVLFIYMSGW